MKRIPLHKLEEFRKQWQGEVADVFDDFLRSKATCISDRMEKELVEVTFFSFLHFLIFPRFRSSKRRFNEFMTI